MNHPLVKLLQEHLAHELSSLSLVGQSGHAGQPAQPGSLDAVRPPQIFIGDLPAKRREKEAREIPCVVILPLAGWQEGGMCVSEVALLCAVYGNEEGDAEAAENYLALLLDGVSRALAPCARGVPLGRRFNLVPDQKGHLLAWSKDEKQPQPFMQAIMMSLWQSKGWE